MRHYLEDGGPITALGTPGFVRVPFEPALAEMLTGFIDNLERALPASPERNRRPARRIGKLVAYRPRPRRLDARIVTRRPMMLVKPRPCCPPAGGIISGREIIART